MPRKSLCAILSRRAKRSPVQPQVLQHSLSFHQCSILNHSFIHPSVAPLNCSNWQPAVSLPRQWPPDGSITQASETRLLLSVKSSTSIHPRDRMDQFLPKSQEGVSRIAVRDWSELTAKPILSCQCWITWTKAVLACGHLHHTSQNDYCSKLLNDFEWEVVTL